MTRIAAHALLLLAVLTGSAEAAPCDDIATMYTNMAAASSYRVVDTSAIAPPSTTEFVAPDRYHAVMGSAESITIGSKSYTKQLGKWYGPDAKSIPPFSLQMAKAMKAAIDAGTFAELCAQQNASDEGMKDGLHVIHLHNDRYAVDTVFYLQPDLLPARIETTTRGKTFVQSYAGWNDPITIDAPF